MSSLQHILAEEPPNTPPPPPPPPPAPADERAAAMPPPANIPRKGSAEDHTTLKAEDEAVHTSTTSSTRRNASGSVSSVYSGNKMKHLKKEDGIPLWRKDIQYDFLRLVFYDKTRCFTKYSDKTTGHTFTEIYIDAMAKSSKCSKILKEKLLADTEGAISMAMVCLLVNVGRMNTTLNCEGCRTIVRAGTSKLTLSKSSLKCARSFELITPSQRSRRTKIQTLTSSFKMRQD